MNVRHQTGATLVVALVALIVLTIAGMATMGDLLLQSTTVRNEQFRQKVFYAASSELNAIVGEVNSNDSSEDDQLIDSLLDNQTGSSDYDMRFGTPTVPTRSSTIYSATKIRLLLALALPDNKLAELITMNTNQHRSGSLLTQAALFARHQVRSATRLIVTVALTISCGIANADDTELYRDSN